MEAALKDTERHNRYISQVYPLLSSFKNQIDDLCQQIDMFMRSSKSIPNDLSPNHNQSPSSAITMDMISASDNEFLCNLIAEVLVMKESIDKVVDMMPSQAENIDEEDSNQDFEHQSHYNSESNKLLKFHEKDANQSSLIDRVYEQHAVATNTHDQPYKSTSSSTRSLSSQYHESGSAHSSLNTPNESSNQSKSTELESYQGDNNSQTIRQDIEREDVGQDPVRDHLLDTSYSRVIELENALSVLRQEYLQETAMTSMQVQAMVNRVQALMQENLSLQQQLKLYQEKEIKNNSEKLDKECMTDTAPRDLSSSILDSRIIPGGQNATDSVHGDANLYLDDGNHTSHISTIHEETGDRRSDGSSFEMNGYSKTMDDILNTLLGT